jgi:Fe2+ transport system protein B
MRGEKDQGKQAFIKKIMPVLRHTTVRTLLLVFVIYLVFQVAMLIRTPMVVSSEVREEIAKGDSYIKRIEVSFDINPEDFHIKTLQRFGAIAGVTDHSIYLMYVPYRNIDKIARLYWVKKIDISE